jgi:hypothetical protein
VHSAGEFTLKITLGKAEKTFAVKTGDNVFSIPAKPASRATLDGHGEAQLSLDKNNGSRYLWQLQERDN